MSADSIDLLTDEDNFFRLCHVCMLLRAASDLLLNDSCDIFHIVYACTDESARRAALSKLDLLSASIVPALSVLESLCQADRASWKV